MNDNWSLIALRGIIELRAHYLLFRVGSPGHLAKPLFKTPAIRVRWARGRTAKAVLWIQDIPTRSLLVLVQPHLATAAHGTHRRPGLRRLSDCDWASPELQRFLPTWQSGRVLRRSVGTLDTLN